MTHKFYRSMEKQALVCEDCGKVLDERLLILGEKWQIHHWLHFEQCYGKDAATSQERFLAWTAGSPDSMKFALDSCR